MTESGNDENGESAPDVEGSSLEASSTGSSENAAATPSSSGSAMGTVDSTPQTRPVESYDERPSGAAFESRPNLTREISLVADKLTRAIYCSLSPTVVVSIAITLILNAVFWRFLSLVFWQDFVPNERMPSLDHWIFPAASNRIGWVWWFDGSLVGDVYRELVASWTRLGTASGSQFLFQLVGALGSLAIWGLVGTFVCRLIGLRINRGTAKVKTAGKFAWDSFVDSFGSIAIPLTAVAIFSLPLMIAGLFLAVDALSPIGALLSVVFGVLSIPMAVVLVGLMLCWPLMFPAIAMEGRDCFESISRGYAYVLQRPFHYLVLVLVAAFAGLGLSWLFQALGDTAVGFLNWALSWGANVQDANRMSEVLHPIIEGEDASSSVLSYFSSPVTRFWSALILLLVRSAKYSVFWGLATGIYILMRHYLDQTPLDSIYLEGDRKLDELQTEADANS